MAAAVQQEVQQMETAMDGSMPVPSAPLVEPASKELMESMMDSFNSSHLDHMEQSEEFRKVSADELREILDWIRANPALSQSNFLCVARGDSAPPSLEPSITFSPTGVAPSHERFLEESWVMVERDPAASVFVAQHADTLQQRRSFIHHWPSFHVASKLGWVVSATGGAFFVGYLTGAKAAIDSLYRLAQHPIIFGGLGAASAVATALAPDVALTALKYIVIGGVFGGAAVATPVFIVGSAGVFVAAAVYHSFETTKRLAKAATSSNK